MQLYEKMLAVMEDVNREVAEREDVVEAIAVALLARKNVFLLGRPGQAKSYVINRFRVRIEGARQFTKLMTKGTDEEQVFGRPDLSSLIPGQADPEALSKDPAYQACSDKLKQLREMLVQSPNDEGLLRELAQTLDQAELARRAVALLEGNQPRLITKGKVPDADIVFLDELFKAGDGVINAFLTAFNERVYTNEGRTVTLPTISFFAASNEIPDFSTPEKEDMEALYDRLDLKLVTDYVQEKDARLNVLLNKQNGNGENITATVTLAELLEMQNEVAGVIIPPTLNDIMDKVLCDLRRRGMAVSDRTYFNYFHVVRAMAWLRGAAVAEPKDMLILRHCLWQAPEEYDAIREVLTSGCISPLTERIREVIQMARDAQDSCNAAEEANLPKRMRLFRSQYARIYDEYLKAAALASTDEESVQIEGMCAELEEISRNVHEACGFSYAPMEEIYSLQQTG